MHTLPQIMDTSSVKLLILCNRKTQNTIYNHFYLPYDYDPIYMHYAYLLQGAPSPILLLLFMHMHILYVGP